jgi:hypothetical protein
MYSIHASTLKVFYNPDIESHGPKKAMPLPVVCNTIEFCGTDMNRLFDGLAMLYQAFCRAGDVQVMSADDERLCHAFVDKFNALYASPCPDDPDLFNATCGYATQLAQRIRSGHITLDPSRV